ncbi:MAG TPA: polyprenol monophosphomannose synthase [Candidatus Nanoarchaeia archaeon]|nr:polyprenol monophosphomannose synthase [Candidatus Nanoarchaeia archaeon]
MKTFVMIPTYNENENIKNLIAALLKLKIKDLEIVVVDDNSPDGTWKSVKKISSKNRNVHLLLRKKDKGRGAAGKAGFIYSLEHGADIVIEMDADFSHDPKNIPTMIKELQNADLVLGSRRVKGSREVGRGMGRRILTHLANFYIRILLGLNVRDCNSGFRCFKRKVLEKINVYSLQSKGPAIVQEVLFLAKIKGFKVKEVPIVFVNRVKGESKLGLKQIISGYFAVLKFRILYILGEVK